MKPCVNTTENGNHCKSPEEIYQNMNAGEFAITVIDARADPNNFEGPINKFRNKIFMKMSPQDFTNVYVQIKKTDL